MTRPTMTRRAVTRLALLAAVGLALTGCNVSLQSLPKYSSQHGPFFQVDAVFGNVLNLPAEADVRTGVATIGQVESIKVVDFQARVVLDIRQGVRLPVGTRAEVQFDDPLGDEYVEMVPPAKATDGYLHTGSVLTVAQTGSAPSIADTLAALSTVLNGGGIGQLHTIVTQLDATFAGNQPAIRNLITQVDQSFGSLASHTDDIDAALSAVGNLSKQLNKGTPQIVASIDALQPAVGTLAAQNQQLHTLLTSVNNLAAVANNVVDKTTSDTIADIHELLPVVNQLVGVDSQIGPDLADLGRFEEITPKIAPGNSLQVSLSATADLSGSGTADVSSALRSADVSSALRSDGDEVTAASGNPSQVAVSALFEGSLP